MWNPFELTEGVFGRNGLVRASNECVASLLIPEKSKEFLVKVGVPKENILLCEFDLSSFPFLKKHAENKGITVEEDLPYKVIGNDGYMQICLSEQSKMGEVIAYDLNGELPIRYINCNIETFIAFLALYVKDYCKYNDQKDDVLDEYAEKLEAKMKVVDPKAFSNPDNWWFLVTQQMKEGML